MGLDEKPKLYVFTKNPVIISKREACSDKEVLEAYYEHCIREIVRDFITSILQEMSHEELDHYRIMSLDILVELIDLADKSEIVQTVISVMVNKFGDKVKKVQCHAINKLISLVRSHHQKDVIMAIIMREINLFMERPGTKPSHRIYALGFLNKVVGTLA